MEDKGRDITFEYSDIYQLIDALFRAKNRGEHVFFNWQGRIIVDSNKVENIDDAYLLLFGKTKAEEEKRREDFWKELDKEEKTRNEVYQKWIDENYKKIVLAADTLFLGNPERVSEWKKMCEESKNNQISFFVMYDAYKVLLALKDGISEAIAVLENMESRVSGTGYNSIKKLVCFYSDNGTELYSEYESKGKKTIK